MRAITTTPHVPPIIIKVVEVDEVESGEGEGVGGENVAMQTPVRLSKLVPFSRMTHGPSNNCP